MSNREQITKLIKDYDLHADDVYIHKTEGWKIIKRRGYKRIQAGLKIEIDYKCPHATADFAVIIATGSMWPIGGNSAVMRSTLGEASPRNSTFEYPVAVAQKRAEGKLILEMANLYQKGFMTEDEVDLTTKSNALIKKNEKIGKSSVDGALSELGLKPKEDETK